MGMFRMPTAIPIPHIAATAAREYMTKIHLIFFTNVPSFKLNVFLYRSHVL